MTARRGDLLDFSRPLRIHIVGIGGTGMSSIATALSGMGHQVTGSDLKRSPAMERLRAAGIELHVGHRVENVSDVDAVTYSSAVPESNLELAAARQAGIPVLTRARTLASICATRRTVAVCGTHGKTTTASMLALILVEAGMEPSFIIGGELNEIGTGAVWDGGEWLVVEADESDGSFLELWPEAALLTNVEPDHLDHYGSVGELERAFDLFLNQVSGPLIACADDPVASSLGATHDGISYGQSPSADYRAETIEAGRSHVSFALADASGTLGRLELPVPGVHNAVNAAGAAAMGLKLGADLEAARRALARFAGVARRFQFRGEHAGVTFVDDYAHLPGEIRAALAAASAGGWRRVVCVFQPHRYSRTASLWREFGDAFAAADLVVVTDVYSAGESPRPGISGKLVVQAVLDAHPETQLAYLPQRNSVVSYLERTLRPGDVCVTLGAGDVTSLPDELAAEAV